MSCPLWCCAELAAVAPRLPNPEDRRPTAGRTQPPGPAGRGAPACVGGGGASGGGGGVGVGARVGVGVWGKWGGGVALGLGGSPPPRAATTCCAGPWNFV